MLWNVNRMQHEITAMQKELAKSHEVVLTEMTKVRDMSSILATTNRRTLKGIREELEHAREDVNVSAGHARIGAMANVDKLAKELRAAEVRQKENQERVQSQLADTRQAAASTEARLTDVRSEVGSVKEEVGSVKNEVAATQADLLRTASDLRRVVGDMGVISGRIATNHDELAALRALGERTYTEFQIGKSKEAKMVNGIGLLLKRTDPGTGKFTVELSADDKRVQKKDKSLNEPVQFYVSKGKQPYELVVNSVSKNQIAGYLSIPKVHTP